MNLFPELAANSKVWIYQSQVELSKDLQEAIQKNMNAFVENWAAHGAGLFARATILEDYFLVFAVDESQAKASGCSIDSSVRFVKELGNKLNIDFFNRLNVLVEKQGVKQIIPYHVAIDLTDCVKFNVLAEKLGDLNMSWRIQS